MEMTMRKKWMCSGLVFLQLAVFYIPAQAAEHSGRQEEAVHLARDGAYAQSLDLFRALEQEASADERFWQDYITVLCWAGESKRAVAIADERYPDFRQLPGFVLKALEGAYLKEGQQEKADLILSELAQKEEAAFALRWAKRLLEKGRATESRSWYDRLIAQGAVAAETVYLEFAVMDLKHSDYSGAEEHMEKALSEVAKGPEAEAKWRDLEGEFAAQLIQANEAGAAAQRLRPYVYTGTASPKMAGNYFFALRMAGKLDTAEFERLYSDWSELPLYGLQAVGDTYFRQRHYQQAEKLYAYILQKDPTQVFVRAAYAYCLAMRDAQERSVEQYHICLKEQLPRVQAAVAADGMSFVASGKIHLARQIFALLGNTPEEKRKFQFQYAQALSLQGYPLEAKEIYQRLEKDPAVSQKAADGLAANAIRQGLYQDAADLLRELEQAGPAYSEARILYASRQKGFLGAWFQRTADYKGNDNHAYGLYSESYLDRNVYFTLESERDHLKKEDFSAQFRRNSFGVSWRYDRGRIDIARSLASGEYDKGQWRYFAQYGFNDRSTLSLTAGHRAHMEAGAVQEGVDESFRLLRWRQQLDERNLLELEYEWAALSDGNGYDAYGVSWTHNTKSTPRRIDNLLLRYGWSGYAQAADAYEAPALRVNTGLGFSRKWLLPENGRTWEWILMTDWGRDNDEPMDFTPYTRVVLTQDLPEHQALSVGLEYGWRTNRLEDNSDLLHGYHQIDFNYSWEW